MPRQKQQLIVILGPTASGKTELALRLAKKFNGYIISADSRQVYKGMNIGTGKIKGYLAKNEYLVQGIPHFMIDIAAPDQEFTLADYQRQVFKILGTSYKRQNTNYSLPFLVGGTGLYISAIVDNYQLPQGKVDKKLRQQLEKKELEYLLKKLKKLDPGTYAVIDKSNKRRVLRALEYVMSNQTSFTKNKSKKKAGFDILQIGIQVPQTELRQRIDKRVDKMMEQGLVEEVKNLVKKYSPESPPLSGIGYREIISFLNSETTQEQAIALIKQRTRQYAKRQLTWFKRDKRIQWVTNSRQAEKLVKDFLSI